MLDIEYGTYSLTCTCDGYTTLNEEITVDTNSTNVTYELTKQYTVTGPTLQEEEGEW